jgi:bifunctional non-homologous end joining protein LigD
MLATLVRQPFHLPGWVYEEKYDGYRILAYKEGARVTLLSRNDIDRTQTYAQVADAVSNLAPATLLLDGEVVALDKKGVSRFEILQGNASEGKYAVFDCLYVDGRDLRREPLSQRRHMLESVLSESRHVWIARRLADNGLAAFEVAKKKGYEGVVAKDASSFYVEARSRYWLKVKVHQEDEFIIVGYTRPSGARKYIGALLLAGYHKGKLQYVGKVGTGFSQEKLKSLYQVFKKLKRDTPPVINPPRERGVVYLEPKLVAQIVYQEWTNDLKLRQPVFLGLRDDKSPEEVTF